MSHCEENLAKASEIGLSERPIVDDVLVRVSTLDAAIAENVHSELPA